MPHCIQQFLRVTQGQQSDLVSLILFFQDKESRLQTQLKWSTLRWIAGDPDNATQLQARPPGHARSITHVMFTSAREP
jgi:hypothetical protein